MGTWWALGGGTFHGHFMGTWILKVAAVPEKEHPAYREGGEQQGMGKKKWQSVTPTFSESSSGLRRRCVGRKKCLRHIAKKVGDTLIYINLH